MKPKTDTKGSKGLEAELRRHSLLPPKRVGSAQQRRPFRDVRPKRGEGPLPALSALPLARLVQPAAFMAAGLAAAKLNVLPNAKGSAAAVVKSGCESDRDPYGPRRGAARDHDAA